jgi:hypothetical protein
VRRTIALTIAGLFFGTVVLGADHQRNPKKHKGPLGRCRIGIVRRATPRADTSQRLMRRARCTARVEPDARDFGRELNVQPSTFDNPALGDRRSPSSP